MVEHHKQIYFENMLFLYKRSMVQNAGWYPLNRWTFSNRTWYCDASSWTAVTQCLIKWMVCRVQGHSHWGFKLLVTVCPDGIFWTIWPQPVRRTTDSRDVPLPAKPSCPILTTKPSCPILTTKPSCPILTTKPSCPILTTKPISSDPCPCHTYDRHQLTKRL